MTILFYQRTNIFGLLSIFGFFLLGASVPLSANCVAPGLLSANFVTDTSAELTWTDVATLYDVELRPASEPFTGIPNYTPVSDPPFLVTDLVPGQLYRFRVRARCFGGGNSIWSSAHFFTTDLSDRQACVNLPLRDTSCTRIRWRVRQAPGTALGTNVRIKGVRLAIQHPSRGELRGWLTSPDGTQRRIIASFSEGDRNIGNFYQQNSCSTYIELKDDPSLPSLSDAKEEDNITGQWRPDSSLQVFHNGQSPNGTWELTFCDQKLLQTGVLRLAQLVFEPLPCSSPQPPQLVQTGLESATVIWDPSGLSGQDIRLVVGPEGFIPELGEGNVLIPATTTVQLEDLEPLRSYQVFLGVACGPEGFFVYSAPLRFQTACPPQLLEDFNTLSDCSLDCETGCPLPGIWQNTAGDDFDWKIRSSAGLNFPTSGPKSPAGGSGSYLFFRNSCSPGGANGKKAVLRTRCLDILAVPGSPCHFSMEYYMNTKLGQMGRLSLEGSVDGGATWQTIKSWTGNQGKQWHKAYVDLSAYHQKTALFQLTAVGTFGAFGDISIDNLHFYGASPASSIEYTYYQDLDGDGFGNTAQYLISCLPAIPAGYTAVPGDCNDAVSFIYPGAPEIPCNGLDENCNGNQDAFFLAPPVLNPIAPVCQGDTVVLSVQNPMARGTYYWFNTASGGTPIASGPQLSIPAVQSTQTVWVLDSITNGGCASARTSGSILVLEKPALVLGSQPLTCPGSSLSLQSLIINDLQQTTGSIRFHSALPANVGNLLPNQLIVNSDSLIFALKTTNEGCSNHLPILLKVRANPSVQITNGDSLTVCRGASVALSAQSPTAVQYQWSTGGTFPQIQFQANNTQTSPLTVPYSITVTDPFGCSASDTIQLQVLPSITQANIGPVVTVSFCGGNNGSISLQPLDGVAPFTFQWSGPNFSAGTLTGVGSGGTTLSNLTQGGYHVTISDQWGCSLKTPPILVNGPLFTVQSVSLSAPKCTNSTGSITINASGTGLSYQWSSGAATTNQLTGLAPGIYSVTVTGGNCQQIIPNLELVAPPALQIQHLLTTPNCFNSADGAIAVAGMGGTPGYSFKWENNSSQSNRNNLTAGSYSLTLTDSQQCSVTESFTLSAPEPPSVMRTQTDLTCFESADGTASIKVNGGTPPWQAHWSNGNVTNTISQLIAGQYFVTLTDHNGCSLVESFTIQQPAPLMVGPWVLDEPTCAGVSNGSLQTSVQGGTMPYQYLWNTGSTNLTLQNIDRGNYQLQVTDARGCTFTTAPVFLDGPQLIELQADSIQPVLCHGGQNGFLQLSVSGSVGALQVLLNGAPSNLQPTQLPAGIYTVRVRDTRGCTATETYEITQPEAPIKIDIINLQDVPCAGTLTGSIHIKTSGGTEPYQYFWSNGATTANLEAAPAGFYDLSVQDANLCSAGIIMIEIKEPEPLVLEASVTDIPCFGPNYGSISLSTSGGLEPYTYQWSTGDIGSTLFGLPIGTYSVSVFDSLGCFTSKEELVIRDKSTDFKVLITGNLPVSCTGGNDGLLVAVVFNGRPPYQFSWSAPVGLHPDVAAPFDQATGLSGGYYSVTVTDADGCFNQFGPVLLEESPPVAIQLESIQPVLCKGQNTGAIEVSASGGVPSLKYHWSSGQSTAQASQLTAGTYFLTVTDFRGCTTVSAPFVVPEPDQALSVSAAEIIQDLCNTANGAIYPLASGGTPSYEYLWNNGNTAAFLENLEPGTYQLTLTDGGGCTLQSNWVLHPQPDALSLADYQVQDVVCKGAANGFILTEVTGGHLPLNYFWNNGGTGYFQNNLSAGTYQVTVTDQQGCSEIYAFPALEEPSQALSASYSVVPSGSNYTVTLLCTGGVPSYEAEWGGPLNGLNGLVLTDVPAGTYPVIVTDASGCTLSLQVNVATSAASEPALQHQVRIFPNPFNTHLTLEMYDPNRRIQQATLYTALGQVEQRWENIGQSIVLLETNGLPAGYYLLEVLGEDGTSTIYPMVKSD